MNADLQPCPRHFLVNIVINLSQDNCLPTVLVLYNIISCLTRPSSRGGQQHVTSFLADISDSLDQLEEGREPPRSPAARGPEDAVLLAAPTPVSAAAYATGDPVRSGEMSDADNNSGGDNDDTDVSDPGHSSPVREERGAAVTPRSGGQERWRRSGSKRAADSEDEDDNEDGSQKRRLSKLARARIARLNSSEEDDEKEGGSADRQRSEEVFKLPPASSGLLAEGSVARLDRSPKAAVARPPSAEPLEELADKPRLSDSKNSGTEDFELSFEINEAEFRYRSSFYLNTFHFTSKKLY